MGKLDGGLIEAIESFLSSKRATTLSAVRAMSTDDGFGEQPLPRLVLSTTTNRLDFNSADRQNRILDFQVIVYTGSRSQSDEVAGNVASELYFLTENPNELAKSMVVGAGCSQLDIIDHVSAHELQALWSDRFIISCEFSIPRP